MAQKRYDQFSAGTYDPTKIFLQADPTTGALEKILLPKADGSDGYIQFAISGLWQGDSELFWDNTNKRLSVGPVAASGHVAFSSAPNPAAVSPILRLINPTGTIDSGASLCLGVDDTDNYVRITGYNGAAGAQLYIQVNSKVIFTATATDVYVGDISGTQGQLVLQTTGGSPANGIHLRSSTGGDWAIWQTSNELFIGEPAGGYYWRGAYNTFPSNIFASPAANPAQVIVQIQAVAAQTANLLQVVDSSAVIISEMSFEGNTVPKLSSAAIAAIVSPKISAIVYDTTLNKLRVYTGSWEVITSV